MSLLYLISIFTWKDTDIAKFVEILSFNCGISFILDENITHDALKSFNP